MAHGGPRVAVIIEPARPAGIAELLIAAWDLSPREQEVTRLILQGAATEQIAQQLVISVHTVRQHLKGIFGKAGCAAPATWSPRSSSRTTSRGCATTNAAPSAAGPPAAAR
jgi:DNA-binding CsgD family transcriptional regulator